jgi:hypothetical protein
MPMTPFLLRTTTKEGAEGAEEEEEEEGVERQQPEGGPVCQWVQWGAVAVAVAVATTASTALTAPVLTLPPRVLSLSGLPPCLNFSPTLSSSTATTTRSFCGPSVGPLLKRLLLSWVVGVAGQQQ